MQSVFLELVKLSLIGSLFAVAVMLVRLVFRRAPKWLFCVLWGVVALRLVCPVSIESNVSLVPDRLATGQIITNVGNGYIGEVDIIYESNAGYSNAVEAGRQPVYSGDGYYVVTEKDSLEAPKTVAETIYPILSWVWAAGMVLMLTYTAVSYLLLRRRMEEATRLRDNIWQCEQVDSPFVLGFLKPRICLPYAITEADMANVIAHEQAHIRRRDHWWKPIGFLLLSVHWFNPVLWLAYILLCRDIEAACDEKVIRYMEKDEMRAYSTALLHCSIHRRRIAACPLAFGETGVKERIKRVMNYKKPAFWIVAAAVLVSVIVACCFLTEPAKPGSATEYTITSYLTPAEQTQVTEAYNQSNKGITITVKFGTSEGPRQIELVYRYKKSATKEWMQRDPVIMSLGETATLTVPADNHFIIMAKSLGDYSGNVTFAIEEAPYADKSDLNATTTTETITKDPEDPLTVVSNGENVAPYLRIAYSGSWNGESFLCADGPYVGSVLPQLVSDGQIPCVEYSRDFNVVLGEGVTFSYILLFDEEFNLLDEVVDISDLSRLETGDYYAGIFVKKEGDYIEEAKMNEYVGWVCVVRLSVFNTSGQTEATVDLSNIPGASVHVVDIWDRTVEEQIACDTALEKFWEDETNEYYFSCIKSRYIMVMDSTGRTVDVVTALEIGLITVETLDHFGIGYAAEPKT